MSHMQYKTRGGTPPNGKPRVYFLCHPADFEYYFDSVSNEILAKQNCAIWYAAPETVRDEDFFADLKQMQMFVMPVTTNLLSTANEALDKDFRFAVENHIPVLPLMQESGLEALFNEQCGNLQFLDPNTVDKTAISYEEKLQKYLESVLLSNTDTEKIRAAFDAYIFLSYRKKDRKYAQELMRLIHKNPLLWNVAIWYDEFLVPGENFNDVIRNAIEKSNLFVLAVTPNMVNEPNYVMATEYPLAQEIGKPVLACELLPTDVEALARYFNGLSHCLDPQNSEAMDQALKTALQVVEKGYADPTHTFFMGLAYLGGVDVETDTDRAAELITRAAEAGLPEAMDKLISMYSHGQGIALDYVKAYEWIQRRYEQAKEACPQNATPEQLHALFLATREFVSETKHLRLKEIGNATVTQMAQRLVLEGGQDPVCLRDLSLCYVHMSYTKDKSEGIRWCQEALDIRIALDSSNRTLQTQRDLASAWNRMRYLDTENAAQCFENALALREAIAEISKEPKDIRPLASLYEEKDIQKAVALLRQLVQQTGADVDHHNLVRNLFKIETQTKDDKDFLTALHALEKFAVQFPTRSNKERLASTYLSAGKRLSQRSKEAVHFYKAAYTIYCELPKDKFRDGALIDTCLHLAEEALTLQDQAMLSLYSEAAFRLVDAASEKDLERLIVLFEASSQPEKAQICREEKDKRPIEQMDCDLLQQINQKRSQGYDLMRRGAWEEARRLYLQGVELVEHLLKEEVTESTLLTQYQQYRALAQIEQRTNRNEEEYRWHMCVLKLSQQLLELGAPQYLPDAYTNLARYYVRMRNYAQAEKLFLQAVEGLENIPGWDAMTYLTVCNIYKDMSMMYHDWGKQELAQTYQKFALRAHAAHDRLMEEFLG